MSNTLRNLMSRGGLSFAHLGRGARASDENDDPPPGDKSGKQGKAEGDDPDDQNRDNGDSKNGKAEGDDPPADDSDKGKKGKRAEDDDDEPDADDDDDEEEMRGNSAAAKARRRERMRCASIMGSQAAGKNPVLAANLAFTTSMTRKEALAVLKGTPAPAAAAPVSRRNPNLGAGGERGVSSEQAIAASWDVAMQKARPSRLR
ncbi:hypothetical protein [Paraburkholderia caribensis]|uniref:hypothetical protein n=1 Tax=Paraburkholderia caribensis TaxID=75105 RepID=UPI001CACFF1A|nr:hypothetical protein [Paraburkholderia caribensis]CAG9256235.1 conserved hypothetical protein [Paraburkholderia caribensis]